MHKCGAEGSAAADYGTDSGFYLRRASFDEVRSVIFKFVNGLMNIRQCCVLLLFLVAQVRPPSFGQFLEGADIQIAIVEIRLKLGHEIHQKTPVLADRVAAQW